MKLTKRRFLTRAAGVTGGAIAAHFLGLFPELGVAQAASPGRPQGRELWGEEAERAFARVESHREAGQFRAYLARQGFVGKGVRQAVAVIAENGSELGHSLVTTLRAANGRTARLVQNRMGSDVKSALATWSDAEPSFLTVYGGRNDQVEAIGTIRTQGMRIVVTDRSRARARPRQDGCEVKGRCPRVDRRASGLHRELDLRLPLHDRDPVRLRSDVRVYLLHGVHHHPAAQRASGSLLLPGFIWGLLCIVQLGDKPGLHTGLRLTDLAMYLGFASAVAIVAVLIAAPTIATRAGGAWARSPIASLPRVEDARLPSVLASFLGAFAIFVALDVVSGGAISSLGRSGTSSGPLGAFAFGVFLAVLLGNVTYFIVRRRRAGR